VLWGLAGVVRDWCTTRREKVRMLRLRWGKCCLLIVWAVAACGSHATVALPTGVPTPRVVEERLLDQIAEDVCPYPDDPGRIDPYERYFTSDDPTYTFVCYPAAGHSLTVTFRRFLEPAEAMAEFQSAGARGLPQEVQGFPALDWQEQHPSFPGGRLEVRVRLLQAGPWLIRIESFDDTHFLIAPDPREASVTVVQAVKEHGFPSDLEETSP
jgi:hypothetical protein